MAVVSGKGGSVTYGSNDLEVRGFDLDETPNLIKYASSQTASHKRNTDGVHDWTARVRLYAADFAAAGIAGGSSVALTLTMASGKTKTGTGITGPVKTGVDVEDGALAEIELTIEAGSALT